MRCVILQYAYFMYLQFYVQSFTLNFRHQHGGADVMFLTKVILVMNA